jgi:hypothetical protein
MNRCVLCGELVEPVSVNCPVCRTTIVTMVPPRRQPRSVVAFLLLLVVIVATLLIGIRAVVS